MLFRLLCAELASDLKWSLNKDLDTSSVVFFVGLLEHASVSLNTKLTVRQVGLCAALKMAMNLEHDS